ncbi:MAG: hypothetical protein QOE96_2654 [Blastocatellia bacterium]|jgi:hypothetical protein|nr:hypothetical protein [Blastocatellia bacterium]
MKTVMRITALAAFCLVHAPSALPQQKTALKDNRTEQIQISAPAPAPKPPLAFGLVEDTPVRIRLARTMSSKDARVDERVDFEVLEDIKVRNVVVVERGALAIATVTEAHPKRRMGRAGKLHMNIDYVRLVNGEKVLLRAVKGGSGGDHIAAMTGAMVATSLVFFPAAPFFLFLHGKDITIPKGTEVTAYVAADTPLDPTKFNKQSAAGTRARPSSATRSPVSLQ